MSWREAKVAALQGVPYYAYKVGPPYTTLPNQDVAQGNLQNAVLEKADARPEQDVNLPHFAQSRYKPHGDYSHGYHLWSLDEMLIESAPIFVRRQNVYAGAIGSMLHAPQYDLGEDMPGSEIRVADTGNLPYQDPGNFMDTLTWGGRWGVQHTQMRYEPPRK